MRYLPIQYVPQPTPDMPTYTGEPAPRPLLPCAHCVGRIWELEERLRRITLWVEENLCATNEGEAPWS